MYCNIIYNNNVSRSKKNITMKYKLIINSIVKVLCIKLIFFDVDTR